MRYTFYLFVEFDAFHLDIYLYMFLSNIKQRKIEREREGEKTNIS